MLLTLVMHKSTLVHVHSEHRILHPKIQRTIVDHAFSPVIARSEATRQSVFSIRKALGDGFPRRQCEHWFLGMTGLFISLGMFI